MRSRAYSEIPGDTRRVLLAPVTTTDGDLLPAGTVYQPLASGQDADAGRRYAEITVLQAGPRIARVHRARVLLSR